MQIDPIRMQCLESLKKNRTHAPRVFALLIPLAWMIAYPAFAQSVMPTVEIASGVSPSLHSVPTESPGPEIDAPQPQPAVADHADGFIFPAGAVPTDQPGGYQVAPLHRKYIMPDMRAQSINARDKVIIGLKGAYSLQNFSGIILAAGIRATT